VDPLGLAAEAEGFMDQVARPGLFIYGFGQGAWSQASGLAHMGLHPIDTAKGIGSAIWNYSDTYKAIDRMVNEELDAADAQFADRIMLEGRVTAEVAGMFIGTGELAALAKSGKIAAAMSKARLLIKATVETEKLKVVNKVVADAAKSKDIVFRRISAAEESTFGTKGINPTGPSATTTPTEHILGVKPSPSVSTTRDYDVALGNYGRGGMPIVEIDLSKVSAPFTDFTIPKNLNSLTSPRAIYNATRDAEVLVHGQIPPEAIGRIHYP